MALTFIAAPCVRDVRRRVGAHLRLSLACALMTLAFQPMLRFYRLSPLWGLALPAIARLYMIYTFESAWPLLPRAAAAAGRGACRRTRRSHERLHRRRTALRQGIGRREFPRGVVAGCVREHRGIDPGILRVRAHRRRHRRSRQPSAEEKLAHLDRLEGSLLGRTTTIPPASRFAQR